ncbi:hypothetical protein MSG28_000487 [Choristoneura fumiferana]|uniref:Uncharacterized protein n=1 Tax=Choristoneura fumiferana TaxID=7141 RepID=A0ACC0K112_CHOFU|nr:hypothetical protein MSG28_000487 [Choristoneura fumiferana]
MSEAEGGKLIGKDNLVIVTPAKARTPLPAPVTGKRRLSVPTKSVERGGHDNPEVREGDRQSQGGVGFIVHKSLGQRGGPQGNNVVKIECVDQGSVPCMYSDRMAQRYSLKVIQAFFGKMPKRYKKTVLNSQSQEFRCVAVQCDVIVLWRLVVRPRLVWLRCRRRLAHRRRRHRLRPPRPERLPRLLCRPLPAHPPLPLCRPALLRCRRQDQGPRDSVPLKIACERELLDLSTGSEYSTLQYMAIVAFIDMDLRKDVPETDDIPSTADSAANYLTHKHSPNSRQSCDKNMSSRNINKLVGILEDDDIMEVWSTSIE